MNSGWVEELCFYEFLWVQFLVLWDISHLVRKGTQLKVAHVYSSTFTITMLIYVFLSPHIMHLVYKIYFSK